MPETTFAVRWPDGSTDRCYSPSLVVHEHLEAGTAYEVGELVARSRTAMTIASDRVLARFGFPCSAAAATLAHLEATAARFSPTDTAEVLA